MDYTNFYREISLNHLYDELADVIRESRELNLSDRETAVQVIRHLKKTTRTEVKPKRGIGFHTQGDILK